MFRILQNRVVGREKNESLEGLQRILESQESLNSSLARMLLDGLKTQTLSKSSGQLQLDACKQSWDKVSSVQPQEKDLATVCLQAEATEAGWWYLWKRFEKEDAGGGSC